MAGIQLPRRFGVELEGFVDTSIYGGRTVEGHRWDIDDDGSVSWDCNCDDDCCCDCQSEHKSIEAKNDPHDHTGILYDFYRYLDSYDWEVNGTAGLHIHVECNDYDAEDFQKLLALMVGIEPYIYSVTNEYRYHNSYCRPLTNSSDEVDSILRRTYLSSGIDSVKFTENRYYGLNFESYHSWRPTVEFRYFYPQTTADKVEAYVELVNKTCEFAKHATLEQVLVITNKLLDANLSEARTIIHEVLQLECGDNLVVQNNVYDRYDRNQLSKYMLATIASERSIAI